MAQRSTEAYDSGVRFWGDPGVLRAKCIYNPSKTEVYSAGHEGWSNGQTHDLHEETIITPLILPAHETPRIAKDFQDDAGKHGNREGRGASCEGIGGDVSNERDGEQSDEGGIGAQ
jgi:hypothetical protein